jgi:hypothetical protein
MEFEAGDVVECRHGWGTYRFGRVQGRCHPGGDQYYVTVNIGMTHIDHARNLRPADRIKAPQYLRWGATTT